MPADSSAADSELVCPRCGAPPADPDWCQSCGLNLRLQQELPTKLTYEAARLGEAERLADQQPESDPAERPATSGDDAPARLHFAGWGARAAASLVDGGVLFIPVFILAFALGGGVEYWIVALGIIFGYCLLRVRHGEHNGQTPGMQLMGIRVIRVDQQPVSTGTVFGRDLFMQGVIFGALASLFFYVPAVINYLWPLWDRENRTLHDMVASTRVVHVESRVH